MHQTGAKRSIKSKTRDNTVVLYGRTWNWDRWGNECIMGWWCSFVAREQPKRKVTFTLNRCSHMGLPQMFNMKFRHGLNVVQLAGFTVSMSQLVMNYWSNKWKNIYLNSEWDDTSKNNTTEIQTVSHYMHLLSWYNQEQLKASYSSYICI